MRIPLCTGAIDPEGAFKAAVAATAEPLNHRSMPAFTFESLFAEYQPLVYGVGLRFLGNHQDAEDATQEVFTKVWKSLKAFNRHSSLKTWIYRIAINTCIDHG